MTPRRRMLRVSEWLDLLIEEVDRKKRELDEALAESRRRDPAETAPDDRHDHPPADTPASSK